MCIRDSYDLRRIGGLYAARPWLAVLFLVTALAQVGIPPLSGFWGKLLIVRESFVQGQAVWGAVALGVGLLTLYSMAKIWMEAVSYTHLDVYKRQWWNRPMTAARCLARWRCRWFSAGSSMLSGTDCTRRWST